MPKYGGLAASGCLTARSMWASSSVTAAQRPSWSLSTPRNLDVSPGRSGAGRPMLRFGLRVFRLLYLFCGAGTVRQMQAVRKQWRGKDNATCGKGFGKPNVASRDMSPPTL